MRLFAGIPLAAPVVDELSAISLRLRAPGDGLRWSTPESWHVTLQFLGSVSQEQYECIVARLCRLRLPPVPIRLDAMGFFDRAGIFFAGVSPTPELLSLQQAVTAATGVCGFVPETRPYHPHITLARTKGKAGGHALSALKSRTQSRTHRQPSFTGFTAEVFLLYESFIRPTGSEYEIRERFRLTGE